MFKICLVTKPAPLIVILSSSAGCLHHGCLSSLCGRARKAMARPSRSSAASFCFPLSSTRSAWALHDYSAKAKGAVCQEQGQKGQWQVTRLHGFIIVTLLGV